MARARAKPDKPPGKPEMPISLDPPARVGQKNKTTVAGNLSFSVKPIELKTYQKGLSLSTTGATGLLYGSTVPIDPETSLDIGVIGLAAVLARSNVAISFGQTVSISDRRKRPSRK